MAPNENPDTSEAKVSSRNRQVRTSPPAYIATHLISDSALIVEEG